jgi:hypothetical protein
MMMMMVTIMIAIMMIMMIDDSVYPRERCPHTHAPNALVVRHMHDKQEACARATLIVASPAARCALRNLMPLPDHFIGALFMQLCLLISVI